MIKGIIFDLDGTLLNTLPSIKYYINRTLSEQGYSELTEEECRAFVGDGARTLVERALLSQGQADSSEVDRVCSLYKAAYDLDPYYLTDYYEGIKDAIFALKSGGVRLFVLSNKPHTATSPIVLRYFGSVFEGVVGQRAGVPLKPCPEAALGLLSQAGLSPSECAFVGDTAVDILTGRNSSVALSVGVLWGFRSRAELESAGADRILSHPSELVSLLENDF